MATVKNNKQQLSAGERKGILETLEMRFQKNMKRHKDLQWETIKAKLEGGNALLWSLHAMEETGGEPDVVGRDESTGKIIFYDCSAESPKGRRSTCYDGDALASRKEHKPENSALQMAEDMGIEILSEEQYRHLQQLGNFDTKTSSWIKTPPPIRKLGGALFADYRYGQVFVYHNGAESYYAARGFRGSLYV